MKTVTNDFTTRTEEIPEPERTKEINETVERAKAQFKVVVKPTDVRIGKPHLIPTVSGNQLWQQHLFVEIAG